MPAQDPSGQCLQEGPSCHCDLCAWQGIPCLSCPTGTSIWTSYLDEPPPQTLQQQGPYYTLRSFRLQHSGEHAQQQCTLAKSPVVNWTGLDWTGPVAKSCSFVLATKTDFAVQRLHNSSVWLQTEMRLHSGNAGCSTKMKLGQQPVAESWAQVAPQELRASAQRVVSAYMKLLVAQGQVSCSKLQALQVAAKRRSDNRQHCYRAELWP